MADTTLRDRDLLEFRLSYYGLFVGLWSKEPDPALISALGEDIAGRIEAAVRLHPLMGEGWRLIQRFLSEHEPGDVADEFTSLFLGPMDPKINPYESYYLTGHVFRTPLVAVRGFLKRVGLERREDEFAEPEDVLAFELEVMRWLIQKQKTSQKPADEARWLDLQAYFLKRHLLVWAPACAQDMEKAGAAQFYGGAARVLRGFLEMERGLFHEQGSEKILSLEEARQRYGGAQAWKGPTFDPSGDSTSEGPESSSRADKSR